jgi:hypothetical protein
MNNTEISFNDLPRAVGQLLRDIEAIKLALQAKSDLPQQEADIWFDLNGLIQYLPDHPKRATVYGWISKQLIPYHKTAGRKQLSFLKSDIDEWMKDGKRKTLTDSVNDYFKNKKR